MTIWLDAQLSPAMAPWVWAQFSVTAVAVRDLGLRDSRDREIFFAARRAGAVVMTKDRVSSKPVSLSSKSVQASVLSFTFVD
jgi:predicted nuclease of predicted toxin-antitoxin system